MNSRERLRRCFYHEELDRPGVYCMTMYPSEDPSYDELKALLQEKAELKRGWDSRTAPRLETAQRLEPCSEDFDRRVTIVPTPAGDLRCSELVSRKGQPGMMDEHLLKDRADAEKYLSRPIQEYRGEVESFFERDREMGERGIVTVGCGANPGGTAASLLGSENFALLSVTDRDILHALCERRMREILDKLRYLLARGVGPYFAMVGQEYIVPPLHGPKDFYDFNVKYDQPILDLIHDAGGRMYVHCHGSVKQVFRGFLEAGVDVLHPFEAPPMGDITAREAKALAGARMCLEGNIQIAAMYEQTPAQIRAQTEALIGETFGDRRNLVVCATASPYIRGAGGRCLPQFKAMIETVLNYRP